MEYTMAAPHHVGATPVSRFEGIGRIVVDS